VSPDPASTGESGPGRIVKLPDAVANQIAAGEVVERPVAVVKELMENALDARAGSVEIQFEQGGKALIRVRDNGQGMSREEALMALERHATSKIRSVEDILDIGSFGFRGEALPSIASVSRFTLRTRTAGSPEGTEIQIDGKNAPVVRACGMPPGTDVTVARLFHTVPARRKFLKTDRTEAAHMLQMCRLLAVAHPGVGFTLMEDGHEVFRTPACPDHLQRVREIFGRRRAGELIPIEETVDGIRISGLIGRPGSGRSTRSEMITYVNRRPVDSRVLNYALIESYHRYLPRGRYPMAFLFVDVPGGEVDVNVHPTKREVRFRNEARIRSSVMTRVTAALAAASRHGGLRGAEAVEPASGSPPVPGESPAPGPEASGGPAPPPRPVVSPGPVPERRPFPEIHERPFAPVEDTGQGAAPAPADHGKWRFCGVFAQRIGLFEGPDGLILLHARAARERILFERIEASLEGEDIPRQPLLIPPLLELPPLDAGVLSDRLSFFGGLGFELEPFGRHLFRLRAVPAWLQTGEPEAFVEELVGRIRERGLRPEDLDNAQTVVARLAAVREARGFVPDSPEAWESLARSLLACETPLLDARGRPAFIQLRHGEIARKLMLEGGRDSSERLDDGS
jgi:DNA mismatch repair protein MutL